MILLSMLCLPGVGKSVRFGPNWISVNSSTALQNLQYHGKHDKIAELQNIPSSFQGTHDSNNH